MGDFLEATMLICFGLSWPINLMKAYRARTAKATSLTFLLLIFCGYLAGISAKIVSHELNYVFAVYLVNTFIVILNLGIYARNVALDKQAVKSAAL